MINVQVRDRTTRLVHPRRRFPRALFNDLSRSECLTVLELLHLAMQADRPEQVQELFTRLRDGLAFRYAWGGLIRLGPNQTFVEFHQLINTGCPDDWLHVYWNRGLAELDPALKSALRSSDAVHWQTVFQGLSSRQERVFVAIARQCGLRDGITTASADRQSGFAAFFSLAVGYEIEGSRVATLVKYLGRYILQALRRTMPHMAPNAHRHTSNLSSREIMILNWMKTGKTNRAIGAILGVSERTVRFHIESIFAKLDVVSRSQAVALAIEQGLPGLTEPINQGSPQDMTRLFE